MSSTSDQLENNQPTRNIELLAKVRDHILAEPRRYDQEVVGSPSTDAPCGTAGCIYGWGAVLGGVIPFKELCLVGDSMDESIFEFADVSRLFGFDEDEETIVCDYTGKGWPEQFGEALRAAQESGDKEGQAKAAAAYLDYIITTGKVD